jgi:hypothetical protein
MFHKLVEPTSALEIVDGKNFVDLHQGYDEIAVFDPDLQSVDDRQG